MRMRGFSHLIPIVAGLLLLCASAGQAASTGKIAGVVQDGASGDALPNANIVLVDTELGTISDEEGRFFILNVPPGLYSIRVTYIGYAAYTVEEIRVSAGLTTEVDLKPTSEAIRGAEMIVRAERPIIDKNATNAVRIVSAEDLEIMPFRGVQQVFALQAGVVEQEGVLHIRGSRADEIGYYVEGANARNIVSGNSALGLIDEALAEIQVQAGGFNAEFGGANAGIIMQDLKTGAPDWEFSLLTETDNFTDKYEERFGTYSYGYSNQVATASGPLFGSGKLRAFVAAQRTVEDSDPAYWNGFEFSRGRGDTLVDSGDRSGSAHWTNLLMDENGFPVDRSSVARDTEGGHLETAGYIMASAHPVYRQEFDADGEPVLDEQGQPVLVLDADEQPIPVGVSEALLDYRDKSVFLPDTLDALALRPGNIDHTRNEQYDFNGTLVYNSEPFQLRASALYTVEDWEVNPQPIRNMLNTERLPEADRMSRLINLKGTHFLDPSMYYELNFSLYKQTQERYDPLLGDDWWAYNDTVAVRQALGIADSVGNPYTAQGVVPEYYDINGFPFSRPGTPTDFVAGWARSSRYELQRDSNWGLGGSLTKQTDIHQFKAGFDYQKWESRRFRATLSSLRSAIHHNYTSLDSVYLRYYNDEISRGDIMDELVATAEGLEDGDGSLQDLKNLIRTNSASSVFGFDEFGNEADPSGLEAPRHPVQASAYIQDKVEYDDLIINLGLRYDHFYADSWRFTDQANPKRDTQTYTLVIEEKVAVAGGDSTTKTYMEKTRKFNEFSPRLGFSFPVSDVTVFHAQYGRFVQMPAMFDMFTGGASLAVEMGGQNYIRFPNAFDIEPVRTTQYEIGFEHQFTDFASFDITGFYRDVRGQLQIAKQVLGNSAYDVGAFNYLQNGDFATTKGMEFVVKLRRKNRIRAELNYTLSDARGTGSELNSSISAVENDSNVPTIISPLDFNETHRGNVYVDYRFGANEGGRIFQNAGANLLFKFTSGHQYTLSGGSIGQRGAEEGGILADDDPRQRKPVESINRSTTPWTYELDLRLDKGFDLLGLDAMAYMYVYNLMDRKNEINVYDRTGNATDDGFLTNPELSSQIVEASGGQMYQQLYQAINIANRQHYWFDQGGDLYGEPRQIRFGLKFSM